MMPLVLLVGFLGAGKTRFLTTLIPALSILENIILGAEPAQMWVIRLDEAVRRISSICDGLELKLDLHELVGSATLAGRQKAEIVKSIFRGARILILDEPTSMLAPQESDALFALMHALVRDGSTVIFVTHSQPNHPSQISLPAT